MTAKKKKQKVTKVVSLSKNVGLGVSMHLKGRQMAL